MTLHGFKAANHPQQTSLAGHRDDVNDRATPRELFDRLNERFGFTIDVAAAPHNTKCARFYTAADDGLAQSWFGERVWCNPPYSDIEPWVAKAWVPGPEVVVMLLPANRTEQGWWQRLIEPYRDRGTPMVVSLTTEFLPGRIKFLKPGESEVQPNNRPPFGCVLAIFTAAPAA